MQETHERVYSVILQEIKIRLVAAYRRNANVQNIFKYPVRPCGKRYAL